MKTRTWSSGLVLLAMATAGCGAYDDAAASVDAQQACEKVIRGRVDGAKFSDQQAKKHGDVWRVAGTVSSPDTNGGYACELVETGKSQYRVKSVDLSGS